MEFFLAALAADSSSNNNTNGYFSQQVRSKLQVSQSAMKVSHGTVTHFIHISALGVHESFLTPLVCFNGAQLVDFYWAIVSTYCAKGFYFLHLRHLKGSPIHSVASQLPPEYIQHHKEWAHCPCHYPAATISVQYLMIALSRWSTYRWKFRFWIFKIASCWLMGIRLSCVTSDH